MYLFAVRAAGHGALLLAHGVGSLALVREQAQLVRQQRVEERPF